LVQCVGQLALSLGDRKSGGELVIVGGILALLTLVLALVLS
jgi:hypothetical protein